MRRTTRLKRLLERPGVTVLMEAHNGLSAKLVEEAGFEAIWASGLAIAASLGVRDCNEASWTQILDVAEFMADASSLPMLLDGDTGYGNFNNVRRVVRKLEQRGVAGVCLEDKLFPKVNSFVASAAHGLTNIDEFCGKIRAAKDHQRDSDFVVVARTEAFVEGYGLDEVLDRASAYAASGADAVLVHSKRPDADEIAAFARHWPRTVPAIVVPTTYPHVPLPVISAMGIDKFIFANHSIRTVVRALQSVLGTLRHAQQLTAIDGDIAPLKEVFRLQDVSELQAAERRYLRPRSDAELASVAAGRGRAS
jgi:phosphoenolpyruvate phosphomutase